MDLTWSNSTSTLCFSWVVRCQFTLCHLSQGGVKAATDSTPSTHLECIRAQIGSINPFGRRPNSNCRRNHWRYSEIMTLWLACQSIQHSTGEAAVYFDASSHLVDTFRTSCCNMLQRLFLITAGLPRPSKRRPSLPGQPASPATSPAASPASPALSKAMCFDSVNAFVIFCKTWILRMCFKQLSGSLTNISLEAPFLFLQCYKTPNILVGWILPDMLDTFKTWVCWKCQFFFFFLIVFSLSQKLFLRYF